MKSEMPDRVSADLRKHFRSQERFYNEPNEKHIEQAREEIIEAIIDGLGWKGHTLVGVLESYTNEVPPMLYDRLGAISAHLIAINSYAKDDHEHVERRRALAKWLREIVEQYVPAQWIEDRAAEIAS